jgi:hypothetical protein
MTEKKSILLLASAAALTLALHESAMSEPSTNEPTPTAAAPATTAEPAKVESRVPAPAPLIPGSADSNAAAVASPEIELPPPTEQAISPPPQPASSRGLSADMPGAASTWPATSMPEPPPPPYVSMPGTGASQPPAMTAEERSAMREQRFQRMREQAMQRHQEMTARWDSYWEILDAMTPEQKEAVQAIFGSGKRACSHGAMGRQMPRGMPMQPPFGQRDQGFPLGAPFPVPGYGQGPRNAEPYLREMGRGGTAWPGEQPMYPGNAQPWVGPDQGGYQGPPPPDADYPRP